MTNKKLNVLVVGGTGLVGGHIIRLLNENDSIDTIFAWVRKKPDLNFPKVQWVEANWEDIKADKINFPTVDATICALGTTIKKAGSQEKFREVDFDYPLFVGKKSKEKGVSSFLIVTALGSDSKSSIFYNRVKGEIEEMLSDLKFPYLGIFRPSLLLGNRSEFRIGEKIAEQITGFIPFSFLGMKKIQPVQAEFVARSIIKKLIDQNQNNTQSSQKEIIESDLIQELGKD